MPAKFHEMLSVPSRLRWGNRRCAFPFVAMIMLAAGARAELPDGPGKAETAKLCIGCHEIGKSISLRQDKNGWSTTLAKMVGFGMKGTDQEFRAVLAYLAEHFPADTLPPLNVNKARAIQFESRLSLKRSEAAKIMRYRRKNGDFRPVQSQRRREVYRIPMCTGVWAMRSPPTLRGSEPSRPSISRRDRQHPLLTGERPAG